MLSSDVAASLFLDASIFAKRDCGFALYHRSIAQVSQPLLLRLLGLDWFGLGRGGKEERGTNSLSKLLALVRRQLGRTGAHDRVGGRDVDLLAPVAVEICALAACHCLLTHSHSLRPDSTQPNLAQPSPAQSDRPTSHVSTEPKDGA